ncbi:hypothetical protein GJAV_G00071840 [Gymnothorax javanicus]|nr:hypothetical protein GJAV_G00071840 [Gymnothorax javanicus]
MKTEPVMDGNDYAAVRLQTSLIKGEDIEESIEEKNEYGISREEELVLSNVKEEEEEGGVRQSEEVKRENGVKDEEVERNELSPKNESESDVKNEAQHTGGILDYKMEQEMSSSLLTASFTEQSTVPSPESPVMASSEGNSG